VKLKLEWLRGLQGEELERRKELVLSNKKVLDILKEMLYNMDKKAEVITLEDYDSPSWSHKQAHINGGKAMLRRIISLVDLDDNSNS
jgi:hypothetical protein